MIYQYQNKKRIFITAILTLAISVFAENQVFSHGGNKHSDSTRRNLKNATQSNQAKMAGSVLDQFGRPIFKAKVYEQHNESNLTYTDVFGAFNIQAPEQSILIVEASGYYPFVQMVNTKDSVKIRLTESYLKKPDTLDVLYGRVKKENFLGAVSSIYTKEISSTPEGNLLHALTGRIAGLRTSQYTGFRNPFVGDLLKQVDLIGTQSPSNNFGNGFLGNENSEMFFSSRSQTPIIIIDGVQREFLSLDFENIESVSILKDGMSSIFLGQFSSKPILLITTTKPEKGAPRINFTAQTGLQSAIKRPETLEAYEYAYLYNEAARSRNNPIIPYDQNDFELYRSGTDPYGHPNVDWYNTLMNKTAPISRYNLGVNGGNSTARYVISLGYFNKQGLFKESALESYQTKLNLTRYTVNTNVDVNVTKNFNAALQLFGRIQDGNQPGENYTELYSGILKTPNNAYPIYNPNGTFGGNQRFNKNLMALSQASGYTKDNTRDVMANLTLSYKFDEVLKGLYGKIQGNTTSGTTGAIIRTSENEVFQMISGPTGTIYNRFGKNSIQKNDYKLTSNYQIWYAQASLGWDGTFGKHQIGSKLLADQRSILTNYDLPAKMYNFAAKGSYSYDNKYLAEAALNYSGYNRLEPGYRFGLFYALSGGWKLSEESFIKDNLDWINLLKLRGTFAYTGNSSGIGYFTYRESYAEGEKYLFGGNNTQETSGIREQSALITRGLQWEKAHKLNVGLDVALWNNKLSFTADYYIDRYFDLIRARGLNSSILGADYAVENIGINRYSGADLSLTYQNRINEFNYFVTANLTLENSKIIFQDEVGVMYDYNRRTGLPVGADFSLVANGLIQTEEEAALAPKWNGITAKPGDIRYVDQNNDGIINNFDNVLVGNTRPKVWYGVNFGFNFKGFDFSALVQGVGNNYIYTNDFTTVLNENEQGYKRLIGRWTPETATTATLPRLQFGGNNYNTSGSTFWRTSNNYFRLKNVELGYNLPASFVNKLKISGLRFFVSGLNLFTSSQYDLKDPEVSGNSYPIQRIVNTGVSLKL